MLPILALGVLVVALARPQRHWQEQRVQADAVDIALAIDVSPSMLSRDFNPDRLSVALEVAERFVRKRANDRIGVVIFSAEAFTLCPLTTDRELVQELLKDVQVGRLEDGTAIGMGLATAVNRLKDSPSKGKVIVLLTDGENNAGYITPRMAAEMAQLFGIRVYAIGIGTTGIVLSPVARNPDGTYQYAPRQTSFDTALLEEIAAMTKGKFYRAWTEKELEDIYDEIDQLERTRIEVSVVHQTADYFSQLLLFVLAILGLEVMLRWAGLRSITQ
ncbi:MAG: VWA domain-containing protein [Saprospiraceae bacterium]|nr:VWA domain-containing protein [Saprospiraceae bacterium]MDW8228973.1 VWA domain-containing protein [Saprospiraceae bacterium]